MTSPTLVKLSKAELESQPNEAWNAMVEIAFSNEPCDLSPIQQVAHFALLYNGEVENGGHLQYFENKGTADAALVSEALKTLGALEHEAIFQKALSIRTAKRRFKIWNVLHYVREARRGEFDNLDTQYYDVSPRMNDYLQKYLDENLTSFVDVVE